MKKLINDYYRKIIVLDVGTISFLSLLFYNNRERWFLVVACIFVNSAMTIFKIRSYRREFSIHHFLGKAFVYFLYDYSCIHGLTLVTTLISSVIICQLCKRVVSLILLCHLIGIGFLLFFINLPLYFISLRRFLWKAFI